MALSQPQLTRLQFTNESTDTLTLVMGTQSKENFLSEIVNKSVNNMANVSNKGFLQSVFLQITTSRTNSVTKDVVDFDEDLFVSALKSSFIFLIMVCTILGNVISIIVILRTKALKNPNGYFMISLAFADFIVGAAVAPFAFAASTIQDGREIYTETGKKMVKDYR